MLPIQLRANGLTFSALSLGTEDRLVLLLHGTGASGHSWAALLQALPAPVREATQWLVPDLPGHAGTRGAALADLTLPRIARDLWALLAALQLPAPVLLVGHSAGAALALRMALDAPPGTAAPGVLGFAPSLVAPPEAYIRYMAPLVNPVATSGPVSRLVASLAARSGLIDSLLASTGSQLTAPQKLAYRRLFEDPQHVRGAVGFMAAADLPALNADCERLRTPASFVLGANDHWIPEKALRPVLARHLPRAEVHVWPGGHLVHEESPGPAAAFVARLLASATRPG